VFFYYGQRFESARAGVRLIPVECSNCGCKYFYELARIGTAATSAPYGIAAAGAARRANEGSEYALQGRLEAEAELVPCPSCNWINQELIEGYRRSRYRNLGPLTLAMGFAGAILSMVCAWFISIGPPADRGLLPYFLFGGPAAFASFTAGMLLLRSYLRRRIQPNRNFPSAPTLPFASPPALLRDNGRLRPAIPMQPPVDENEGLLDLQFGRHDLPPICCQCLQPASAGRGHPIQVTRLIRLELPLCEDCANSCQRRFQGVLLTTVALGLLAELGLAALMRLRSTQWWVIVVSVLLLFGAIATVATLLASALTVPARVVGRDRSRGVVRLRFGNVAYVPHIVQLANATGEGSG
jgi:hypothetical protein